MEKRSGIAPYSILLILTVLHEGENQYFLILGRACVYLSTPPQFQVYSDLRERIRQIMI